MVRTTPKKVSGNLQVSNIVTIPGGMAKLFPYTCLSLAWGFACFPKHAIFKAPYAPGGKNTLLSIYPACQLGLICATPFVCPFPCCLPCMDLKCYLNQCLVVDFSDIISSVSLSLCFHIHGNNLYDKLM